MFRKTLPFAVVLFLAACAGTGVTHSACSHCPKHCCEHCEDCQDCECGCAAHKAGEEPCKICMESECKNSQNN